MVKIKKIMIIFVSIIAIITMTGCVSNSNDVKSTDKSSEAEEIKAYEITIESKGYDNSNFAYYIHGVLKNNKKDIDYLHLKIPVYDKDGNKMGYADDLCDGLKKGEGWRFKAVAFYDYIEKIGEPEIIAY